MEVDHHGRSIFDLDFLESRPCWAEEADGFRIKHVVDAEFDVVSGERCAIVKADIWP